MSVVVIIPVYNRARTVLEAVASVACQTRRPDRLIVVDDGSTDDISDRLESWQRSRSPAFPVELIRQENRGAGAARNRGIQAAPGADYFAFLDSDDIWPPDFLERTYSALCGEADAIAATCDRRVVNASKRRDKLIDMRRFPANPIRWMFERGAAIASATLFRAPPIRLQNGFDEHIATGQDTALFLRLGLQGRWLHVAGEPILYRTGLAQSRGESDHLKNHHADFPVQWAQLREDFLLNEGRELADKDPRLGAEVARRWRGAARKCLKRGELNLARRYLKRALRWRWTAWTSLRLASTHRHRAA